MPTDYRQSKSGTFQDRGITSREWEVLQAVVNHLANAEIAAALGISVRTVESHVSNLLTKFEVSDRAGLVAAVRAHEDSGPVRIEAPPSLLRMANAGEFVGRVPELQQLHNEWEKVKGGAQRLVLVSGDAGIGKSRLVAEFTRQIAVSDDPLVLHGRCDEDVSGPFEAVGHALAPFVRACNPSRLAAELDDLAPELSRIIPGSGIGLPKVPVDAMQSDPHITRLRLFDAVTRVLRQATMSSPILLAVDDLHWAPEPTLLLLKHLVQAEVLERTLIVCTLRPGNVSDAVIGFLGELRRDAMPVQIQLSGLHRVEVAQLLGANGGSPLSRDDIFSESLAYDIFSETRGNPLYAAELIRSLGEVSGPRTAGSADVPHGVKDIVAARVRRLKQETQALLGMAAVLGQEFDLNVLQRLAKVDDHTLLEGVEEATHAKLLYDVTGISPDAVERYEFVHAVVRKAIIETISPARTRRIHAAAAVALEQSFPHALEERADEIARHLVQAGPITDRQNVVRYLTMAGRAALDSSAAEEGLRFLDQAMAFMDTAPAADRAELWFQRGLALRTLGRWPDSVAALRNALDIYAGVGDLNAISRTAYAATLTMFWSFRMREACDFAFYGLKMLESYDGAERGRLLGALSFAQAWNGEHGASVGNIQEELDIASRLGDTELRGHGLAMRAMQLPAFLEHSEAVSAGYEALEILRQSDDVWTLTSMLGFLNYTLVGLGRLEEARAVGAELDPIAVRVGNYAALQQHIRMKAMIEFFQDGNPAALEKFARRDLAFSDAVGLGVFEHSHGWLGLAKFVAGEWEEAKHACLAALDAEASTAMVGWGWSALFEVLAYMGDSQAAMDLFEKNRHTLPQLDQANTCGSWVAALTAVDGLVVLGELEQAAELLPAIEQCIQRTGVVCIEFRGGRLVKRSAAIAAAAAGDWIHAERYFREARHDAESMPHVVERAHTLRFHGKMLLQTGEEDSSDRAKKYLEDARAAYAKLAMPRHAAMCDLDLESAQVAGKRLAS
ncbi:AAA family ATPase [Arthrobacter sp. I2-34]|uniref:AAA family ATPase n=1 Tax=Arthrobacter hankyongi TaxID=2904801 RepID=A0ABS9LB80_9MICC|nr:AAA family ATPase [Arthrobacter hankyongi]MCG2623915.1 AAA family ATPase [Arthrobacter hankyongi]